MRLEIITLGSKPLWCQLSTVPGLTFKNFATCFFVSRFIVLRLLCTQTGRVHENRLREGMTTRVCDLLQDHRLHTKLIILQLLKRSAMRLGRIVFSLLFIGFESVTSVRIRNEDMTLVSKDADKFIVLRFGDAKFLRSQ